KLSSFFASGRLAGKPAGSVEKREKPLDNWISGDVRSGSVRVFMRVAGAGGAKWGDQGMRMRPQDSQWVRRRFAWAAKAEGSATRQAPHRSCCKRANGRPPVCAESRSYRVSHSAGIELARKALSWSKAFFSAR